VEEIKCSSAANAYNTRVVGPWGEGATTRKPEKGGKNRGWAGAICWRHPPRKIEDRRKAKEKQFVSLLLPTLSNGKKMLGAKERKEKNKERVDDGCVVIGRK
jgi:hypothetical protein